MRKERGGFSSFTNTRRKKNTQRSRPECDFTLTGCEWGSSRQTLQPSVLQRAHTARGFLSKHHWCAHENVLYHWLLSHSECHCTVHAQSQRQRGLWNQQSDWAKWSQYLLNTECIKGEFPPFCSLLLFTLSSSNWYSLCLLGFESLVRLNPVVFDLSGNSELEVLFISSHVNV